MARKRPRRKASLPLPHTGHVGLSPGEGAYVGRVREGEVLPVVIDYDAEGVREVKDPDLKELASCRDRRTVTWLDVDGYHDAARIQEIGEVFALHPLWVEDILNTSARPKVEELGSRLLVVMQVISREDEITGVEKVALVLGPGWVLSFQEKPGDVWNGVRQRIREAQGRIRKRRADYLLHALMDAVVDHYLVLLRDLEPDLLALEEGVGDADLPHAVAQVRAELGLVRSAVWPLRDAVALLVRSEDALIEPETVPFFRDLSDHLNQVTDAVEQARERATSAMELQLALQNQRLNETMRVLTLVSTVFMPLSFIAGVYGMNFHHMPELDLVWAYPAVLVAMGAVALTMVLYFRRRGLM